MYLLVEWRPSESTCTVDALYLWQSPHAAQQVILPFLDNSTTWRAIEHRAIVEWVGTERGTLRPVSPSPPLPPCVRLSPHTATPGEDFRHLGSADLSETSPALTPYGTSSEDGYFAHLSRCGPSPCTRLSRAPSTMTTLTLSRRLGGFRSCFQPPTSALLTIV